MTDKNNNQSPVLVTTAHRGVFFGWLPNDHNEDAKTLVLNDCRNAIHWSGSKGFLGLAAHGPESGSRVGATAPRVRLHDVTSVTECTPEAAKKWADWR